MKYTKAMIEKAEEAMREEGEDPNIPQYSINEIEAYIREGKVTEANYEELSDRLYKIAADTGHLMRPSKKRLKACKTW